MQENKDARRKARSFTDGIAEFFSALIGDKSRANDRLLGVILGLALGIAAYFFGSCEMLFATYPLGIALLCAADRHLPYIIVGLLLSAASAPSAAVYIGTYLITAVIRILARLLIENTSAKGEPTAESAATSTATPGELAARAAAVWSRFFTESVYLRMASAAVAAFCLSIYAIIAGGFRYYDLFGAFFVLVAAPAATFVFSAAFDGAGTAKKSRLHDLSVLAFLAALTYSVRELTFFGVCVGAFVAFFATLCVGRRRGILPACLCGLALGLAFSPMYAPLFILEAAAAGVLWNISAVAAATAGCVAGIIWGLYVSGMPALSTLLPALLCGAMIFGAADKLALITAKPELIRVRREETAALDLLVAEQMIQSDEACMNRLSSMFAELAEAFHNLSDRLRRPGILDLRRMCDGVFDNYCPACPKRELCWGIEYSMTLGVLNSLTSDLHTKARAEPSTVPEQLRTRCAAMPQIITEINDSCARLTEQALLCDRTGVFAVDYDGISRILAQALESGREDYIPDEKAGALISEELKKLRFSFSGVLVYGGRRKTVAVRGLDPSRSKIGVADLRDRLSALTGVAMSEPVLTPCAGKLDLCVSAARKYRAKQIVCSVTAGDGNMPSSVCGDTAAEFESCTDFYFSLLSDGMGTGREAALSSRICAMFLEKMLSAGNKSEASLRLLNSFMAQRDGRSRSECSATVDLLELDLMTGAVALVKSGAAPTYIKRGGNCFKMQSKTVPVGILDTPDAARLRFSTEPGDRIVMVSDGVTQSREDCVWLVSMLTNDWCDDSEAMAKKIAHRARSEGSDDDITVAIIEIESV